MTRWFLLLVALPAFAQQPPGLTLDPLKNYSDCGPPKRNAKGEIVRRADVRSAFRAANHCPSTLLHTGPCPGWSINHKDPLVCNGCDAVFNLYWVPNIIKSGPGTIPIDRWEQKIRNTGTCKAEIVTMPLKATITPLEAKP